MARYVIGLENVLANIQREMMAVRGRTYKGMFAAMKFLENEMDTVSPTVPIDTKKMRDSWFILGTPHPTNPIVFAGYSAVTKDGVHYPAIVHEMEEHRGAVNWTTPGSGSKWLQIHFDRNRFEMMMIVAQNAKVRGTSRVGGLSSGGVLIGNRTTQRNVIF